MRRTRALAEHPSIEINKPIKPRKFGGRVRTYARVRPGDEFVFVLDLESFSRKK